MTNPKITKEHEAWRKARARAHKKHCRLLSVFDSTGSSAEWDSDDFLAGMAAEHEVARLMGRIEVLREAANAVEDSGSYSEVAEEAAWRTVHLEEEKLAALLETGEVEE